MVIAAVASAWACAGLVHEEGALAESGASEAVLEQTADGSAVTYEVVYTGDAASFGWIVPVAGEVLAVEDGDPARFVALREATAPEVWVESEAPAASGGGCFGGSSKSDAGNALEGGRSDDLTVVTEGFTGTYGYVVLAAADAGDVVEWASSNGWSLTAVEADLQRYLDRGDALVLLDLHPSVDAGEGVALPPVTFRSSSAELRFPSAMARSGAAQRTTIYVAGASRAEVVAGWSQADLSELSGEGDAAALFDARLAELGAERTFARTWSGSVDGEHVTRFDLLAAAEAHTDDAVFGFDGTTAATGLQIWTSSAGAAWLWLPLLGIGALRARSAQHHRA